MPSGIFYIYKKLLHPLIVLLVNKSVEIAICPPSETSQDDELLYERYKSLWKRMEDYKYHIKLLQDRIQKRDFEGLLFMSDEELQLTHTPPIIHVNIDELKQMVTDFEERNREAKADIAEAETIRQKADAHDQWKEKKQRANTKCVRSNKMTDDVKQHIESILKDRFTFISSVVAFNNQDGNVRHLPYVPKGKVYWFTGDFSADNPVFHPSTKEEFEKKPCLYLKKPPR